MWEMRRGRDGARSYEIIVTTYAGVCVPELCLGIVLTGTLFHKNV